MKAAVARKADQGALLRLEEVEVPVPKSGEVLVKVHYAGVCGTDMHIVTGRYTKAKFPLIIGHEFVGEVVETNPSDYAGFTKGEKVAIHPIRTCGHCDACLRGMENVCETLSVIGCHENGGFAEYVAVPINKLLKIPENTDMRLAGLIEPLAIAVHDVRRSGLTVGETAFIIGGGPIGVLLALVAKLAGANVLVSEINEFRAGFIKSLCIDVVDPKSTDTVGAVMDATNGRGADVGFEVSGSATGAELVIAATKRGGNIVVVGVPSGMTPVNMGEVLMKELNMHGVRLHNKSDFEIAINIIASGLIEDELGNIITREFDLSDVEEAMKYAFEDQAHFKVLLKM